MPGVKFVCFPSIAARDSLMKAAVLWKNGPIESAPLQLQEMPDPEPGPGEVVVRVHCCANLPHRFARDRGGPEAGDAADHPGPPGGRDGGRAGTGMPAARPGRPRGDRLASINMRGLWFLQVRTRKPLFHSLYTGYSQHGGYAELACVREDFAYLLPAGITMPTPRRCCVRGSLAIGPSCAPIFRKGGLSAFLALVNRLT